MPCSGVPSARSERSCACRAGPVFSAAELGAEPIDERGDDPLPNDRRVVVGERAVGHL
jgi:hypothetical protein